MKRNFTYIPVIGAAAIMLSMSACTKEQESPGVEYMPDMYRSPAIEAYVDYGQDPFYVGEELAAEQRSTPSARKPAEGTIPFSMDSNMAWVNFPYPYPNTPEGYEQAGAELMMPIPITPTSLREGEAIFNKFCDHCHGGGGKGDGKIVTNGNFPPVPAYDGIAGLTEGKMFHTLTYGKGNMGSHASQLDKLERWKVIQYVMMLQTGKSPEELMTENNPRIDSVMGTLNAMPNNPILLDAQGENFAGLPHYTKIEKNGEVFFQDSIGNVYNVNGSILSESERKALGDLTPDND